MAFDFPNSPSEGTLFAPSGGPVYVYTGGVWRMQGSGQVVTAESYNRFVNGGMQISQEWGDVEGALVAAGNFFHADQWSGAINLAGGGVRMQRVPVPTSNGSIHRFRITNDYAQTPLTGAYYLMFQQVIEAYRMEDLRWGTAQARQVVLRWGWKSPAGTYTVALKNEANNRTYAANFVISAGQANTDTVQTLVIPGDTVGPWGLYGALGIYLTFTIEAGPNWTSPVGWSATGGLRTSSTTNNMAAAGSVYELWDAGLYRDPLNTGVAPPWTPLDFAQELAACQRYWLYLTGVVGDTSSTSQSVIFPSMMRAAPAVSYSPAGMTVANSTPTNAHVYGPRTYYNAYFNARY